MQQWWRAKRVGWVEECGACVRLNWNHRRLLVERRQWKWTEARIARYRLQLVMDRLWYHFQAFILVLKWSLRVRIKVSILYLMNYILMKLCIIIIKLIALIINNSNMANIQANVTNLLNTTHDKRHDMNTNSDKVMSFKTEAINEHLWAWLTCSTNINANGYALNLIKVSRSFGKLMLASIE